MENDEMTNDAAVAECPKCGAPCDTFVHMRGGDYGWGTTDLERTDYKYSATTVAELRALIARAIPFLDDHHDAGPPSAGYKSDALESLITEMRNTLRKEKPE